MRQPRAGLLGSVCALGLVTGACAARVPVAPPALSPAALGASASDTTTPPPSDIDLAAVLIQQSEAHFATGQRELQLGHLASARIEFDRALDLLLESPFGARAEPRVREHFDRLVDRISASEVAALAQGDGFAERRFEAATIDELLAISTFETPAPTDETSHTVAADLRTSTHDIEIPLNPRVLQFVELFTAGRMKAFLEEGLSRSVRYLPMVQDVFREEGLPLDLAYLPLVESAFKPSALSRAQARGVWQFMRATALENGLKQDWYVDERAEPEKATRAAAAYLKTLHRMFDGDWHLAMASYNGGPGRVQRALKQSGHSDFWSLAASGQYLPRETRDYVPLVLAAIVVARNPAQYGMTIRPAEAPRVETVSLPAAVDLRRVAEWLGVPVQVIQDLNPELRRWITPVRDTDFALKVPDGMGDIVRAHLADTDAVELAPLNWHTVKKGETLASIARTLKVGRTDLAEANYLSTQARLQIGQRLIIPRPPTLLLTASAEGTESGTNPDASVAGDAATDPEGQLVYRVRRGDTLFGIAKAYRTTVASLKTWNRLRSNMIKVGQRLTIFTDAAARATN